MPATAVEISVSPSVIKWARESAGWDVPEIAQKLRVRPADYSAWESAETPIRLAHLRVLARCFKRPLAAFLLPEPPKEPNPPQDFRLLPGRAEHYDKKTRLAIRRANWLREVGRELSVALGSDLSPKVGTVRPSDEPEGAARAERNRLGVDLREQFGWANAWHAYKQWRSLIEGANVLVFQLSMPLDDARGFSLSDQEPFAIVVSSADAIHARIFTLFHEYAHLLLRRPAVCMPGSERLLNRPEGAVERWCNRFAGAYLIPRDALLSRLEERRINHSVEALRETLAIVSRTFKVSEQAALMRLHDLHAVPRALFDQEMERQKALAKSRRRGGGKVSVARRCLGANGRLFTSLVLEAKGKNVITYADVSDYLSLNLKYLPEVQSSLLTPA